MARSISRTAPKRAANVSIRGDLLEAARSAKLNLSATLEQALIRELKLIRRQQWRLENREAITAYNDYVDANGVFSDGIRRF
jgi:antitoxin CcdA